MSPSFSGVEAWRDADQLEPGPYPVQPLGGIEATESSNGNPQAQIDWRVVAGNFKGAEKTDWVTFTEPAMGRVVQLLEACDIAVPEQDFKDYGEVRDWVVAQLKEKTPTVIAVVRMEPGRKDPSKEFPVIKGYRKPGEGDLENDTSGFTSGPKVNDGDKKPVPF